LAVQAPVNDARFSRVLYGPTLQVLLLPAALLVLPVNLTMDCTRSRQDISAA